MKKNYKNLISISVLILIMCGLVISLTTLTKSTPLNTGNLTNGPSQNNTSNNNFTYIPPRTSLNQNILFENNFGGSKTDEVFEVFNLGKYYTICTTNSQDGYFSNNVNNSLVILILDYYGNTENIFTFSETTPIKIISTKIYKNSIYILINSTSFKLIEFNMGNNNFKTIYETTSDDAHLIVSSEPIMVEQNKTNTIFYFTVSDIKIESNLIVKQILLGTDYLNGTLLFFNTETNFIIATLSKSELNIITTYQNVTLHSFNITDKNFVVVLDTGLNYKIQLLDLKFNLIKELTLNDSNQNFTLLYQNNTHHLFYVNNKSLNLISFCNHGDIIITKQLENNILNYQVLLLNNNFIVIAEYINHFQVSQLNTLAEQKNIIKIELSSNFNIKYFEQTKNLNYVLIGNYNNTNKSITNHFGDTDIFIMEITFN